MIISFFLFIVQQHWIRSLSFRVMLFAIALLSCAMQYWVFKRVDTVSGGFFSKKALHKKIAEGLFIFFNLPFIFVITQPIPLREIPPIIFHLFFYPFYIWQSATFFIFALLFLFSVLKYVVIKFYKTLLFIRPFNLKVERMKTTPSYQKFNSSRRKFLQTGLIGVSGYSFIGSAMGMVDKNEYEVVNRTITIQNLPEEFKGFTIGLISDIHSSVFMTKEEMDEYVKTTNALNTDLILVTGDFVNSQTEEVYPFAEAFSNLKAKHGIYGCLGNHDFFANDVERVAKEVNDCGVKLLRNDAVQISKGNSFFNLIGVDDIGRGVDPDDYLNRALSSVKNRQPKILLCHKPYNIDNFDKLGMDLTLSGHTHGGQIVFAKLNNTYVAFASLFSKYVAGLYKKNNSQMYVNRGIGTVGVPLRINCPPEITKITLA